MPLLTFAVKQCNVAMPWCKTHSRAATRLELKVRSFDAYSYVWHSNFKFSKEPITKLVYNNLQVEKPSIAHELTQSAFLKTLNWGEASVWPLSRKAQISGVWQRWLSFWKFLSSPHWISGATIRFLVTSLTKDPLLCGSVRFRKSRGCFKLLPVKNHGSRFALGDLKCSITFFFL